MSTTAEPAGREPLWYRIPAAIGAGLRAAVRGLRSGIEYVGGTCRLLGEATSRLVRAVLRRGAPIRIAALTQQSYRFGVRSLPIVLLVQMFIGIILVLNLAPTLEAYGQIERVADVVVIAIFRELGPLITAVLLSGFAGASIAAELGAMVEGEEIKALRAHAIDPIRFLVVPRIFATTVMMVALTVMADVAGVLGGLGTAVFVLDIKARIYLDLTRAAVDHTDYLTGLFKAGVFGAVIALLACYEGLNVRGGAEGVGRATTVTVVKSIVALIGLDCIFTAIFYVVGW